MIPPSLSLSDLESSQPGPGPISILQRKFFATLFFKHSDWLLKFINQSGCLKLV